MRNSVAAAVAFVAAAALLALGLLLGSVDAGHGAPSTLLAVAGTVAEVGMLVVLLYAYAANGSEPWAQVGRGLSIAALTLLMAGDATSVDAARDFGNGLLYASLLILGFVMWDRHLRLAAFAIVNGIIGFAFLAFAAALGLPAELNFMLIVIWLVALGVDWLRSPWAPQLSDTARTTATVRS
jgi:hypothetical protein